MNRAVELPDNLLPARRGEVFEQHAVGDVEDLEVVHAVEDEEERLLCEYGAADTKRFEVGEVGGDGRGEVHVEGAHDLEGREVLAVAAYLLHYVGRVGDARHRH